MKNTEKFIERGGKIKNKSLNLEKPETTETEREIGNELEKLDANSDNLKRDIGELGGPDKIGERLKNHPKAEKSFFKQYVITLALLVNLAYSKTFDSPEDEILPTEGKGFFSSENVEKQKSWLKNWIWERRVNPDNQSMIKTIKVIAIDLVGISRKDLGKDVYGRYLINANEVIFNKRFSYEPEAKANPVHEFTHVADAGGVFIGSEERKIIGQVVLDFNAYYKRCGKYFKNEKEAHEYYDYLTDPTEIRARLMALRFKLGLKPDQIMTDKDIEKIYEQFHRGKLGRDMIIPVIKDKASLKRALNELSVDTDLAAVKTKNAV